MKAPRLLQALPDNGPRLAADVRIGATRNGLLLLSPMGCFRLSGPSSESFVSELLPGLSGTGPSLSLSPLSEEAAAFLRKLQHAGIIDESPPPRAAAPGSLPARQPSVVLARRTPLADQVAALLLPHGVPIVDDAPLEASPGALLFADFSDLDPLHASRLATTLHRSGSLSFCFWHHGAETFYGPFLQPGQTACWSCFRQRFSDSLSDSPAPAPDQNHTAARVIIENLLLALRYPAIIPLGCVLVESGDTTTAHSILPMPGCDVCHFENPSGMLSVALNHSPLIPEEWRPLADPRGGVIRRLFLFDTEASETPSVPSCCSARIAPVPHGRDSRHEIHGEGKGASQQDAIRSAIGEGLERYAASLWRPADLIRASFNELQPSAFDPRSLVLFDEEQLARPGFPWTPFHPDRPLAWTTGRWLDTGEVAWVPALAAYMNFPADRLTQITSNGLAAGSSVEDATLRALYELIERDAFMLFWLARLPALPIAIGEDIDPLVHQALAEAARMGARTEIYLLNAGTSHPTVVCIGFGDGQSWPGVTVGLGAHASIDVALRKAVFEHNHFGAYMRQLMLADSHRPIQSEQDVKVALDHGLYYIDPALAPALDAFRACQDQPVPIAELRHQYSQPATLSACVACLTAAGIRTAAVDVTSPDLRLAPIRVVRALGTWMQPIHFGAGNERLNNPRLQRLLTGEPNRTPHPIA